MSQDRPNLGYYNAYNDDMVYTNIADNNGRRSNQVPHSSEQSWSVASMSAATVTSMEAQWPLQYYPYHGGWSEHDMLSPSDITSDASGLADSATPSLHRSDSGEFSEVWDQEPFSIPFSQVQPLTSSNGLLNSIGSSFAPIQATTCAVDDREDSIHQYGYMLDDVQVNDPGSSPAVSDSHSALHQSPPTETASCFLQAHERSPQGRQRKGRQPGEVDNSQSKKPARVNSTRARLFCEACRDSKDYSRGFRGEHELARHYAQKHTKHKKVWKCFDLSPDRLMRNCERCKTGHQYGTSYGGAEHFRRKHTAMFGKDMMELLRGKNQRWALSSSRLIEEGWLRQVFVPGDGEPSIQQVEQSMAVPQTHTPCLGGTQELSLDGGLRMAHLQPFNQPRMPMHHANLAYTQQQYQSQQPYHHQHQHQHEHHHQHQHLQQWPPRTN